MGTFAVFVIAFVAMFITIIMLIRKMNRPKRQALRPRGFLGQLTFGARRVQMVLGVLMAIFMVVRSIQKAKQTSVETKVTYQQVEDRLQQQSDSLR
jgi:large-conductance mechanosensitive channel